MIAHPPISINLLRNVGIFSAISEDELKIVHAKLKKSVFEAGAYLCVENTEGDCLFIIESGEVSVLKNTRDNNQIEITLLKAHDIAGEMALFGQMLRSATLCAKTKVTAWVLTYTDFNEILNKNPSMVRGILVRITGHLRRETSLVAKLLGRDMDTRFKVAFFDSKPYMEESFCSVNPYNYSYHFFDAKLAPETVALAAGCNAVCVFVNDKVNAEVVEELSGLGIKIIALRCAGFDNVDLAACRTFGISVVRVPAYSPHAVAEHAVALMLALNRKTHRANNRVRENNFSLNGLVGFNMHGKTAGIIGAGKIGKCVINILAGFGCQILVYDPLLEKEYKTTSVDLNALYSESDIISLHVPLTVKNKHMINSEAIGRMKKGVMLINTSRGGLVDTYALIEGLKSGRIGYAGLDVYEEESAYFFEDVSARVMADDTLARLLTFNNALITSHQAFLTDEALNNIAQTTIDNIREFETGKKGAELKHHVQ